MHLFLDVLNILSILSLTLQSNTTKLQFILDSVEIAHLKLRELQHDPYMGEFVKEFFQGISENECDDGEHQVRFNGVTLKTFKE